MLHPPEKLENENAREWLAGYELRGHRGVFRNFVEGGNENFIDDESTLFVK